MPPPGAGGSLRAGSGLRRGTEHRHRQQPANADTVPIADTGYAGFEKQWTVKEKPVTNYGDEKIFTVTYAGGLSRSEFKTWWESYDISTIKEYAERMIAEVQSEVPGYFFLWAV